jgi:hypothetical protein
LSVDQAPAITSANHASATLGKHFTFQVAASGYPAPSFSETGALPKGVTFSAALEEGDLGDHAPVDGGERPGEVSGTRKPSSPGWPPTGCRPNCWPRSYPSVVPCTPPRSACTPRPLRSASTTSQES